MNKAVVEGLEYEDIKPEIGARVLCSKHELLSGVHADALRELLEFLGVLVFTEVHFVTKSRLPLISRPQLWVAGLSASLRDL